MSEQEIKEQIERDTLSVPDWYTNKSDNDKFKLGRFNGATDQDKIATNRTVDAALVILRQWNEQGLFVANAHHIIAEIEKLKR